jgi:hypothetical protein
MQQAAIKRRKASLLKSRGKDWKLRAKAKKSLQEAASSKKGK